LAEKSVLGLVFAVAEVASVVGQFLGSLVDASGVLEGLKTTLTMVAEAGSTERAWALNLRPSVLDYAAQTERPQLEYCNKGFCWGGEGTIFGLASGS
jgi:hypothetical protein